MGVRAVVAGNPSIQAIAANLIEQYACRRYIEQPGGAKNCYCCTAYHNMTDDNLGTLVQLNNYEFITSRYQETYADTSAYRNE